jgi:two-component system sensor histidine kinase VicK
MPMEDVTTLQKKLAEYERQNQDLLLQNEELKDFVENASIPLHSVNEEGIITWANQAELDSLGYTADEYIGKPIQDFHADSHTINDILVRLKSNETLINYPATLRCKDGSTKHVLINSNVYRKDDKFIRTRCFTRDISLIVAEEARKEMLLTDLENRQSQLQMAIELTNLGTWEWNPVNNILFWSNECRSIYGLPDNLEPTFELFGKLIHPDDYERVQKRIQNALNSEDGIYEITNRIVRYDDQTIRWIKVKGKVIFNDDKLPDRFIGTVVDITESKQVKEKILRSEHLFRSIALNIPNSLVIVIDKNHRFITLEGDLMQKMGYYGKDYIGKHPTEVAPPERYEASKHLYEKVLAGEKFSLERKGPSGGDFMVHFVPLMNDEHEVEAGLIIAMDITEIKEAQEKSAKLAAIIESSDDAIISKTLEGIITSWNDSAQRTFGYHAEEMIGVSILKLIPDDRKHEETQILSRLKKGERVEHFETKRLKKDGSLLDVSLTISPIKDQNGKIIGLSKIARDISLLREAGEKSAKLGAIIESSEDAIISKTLLGIVTSWNASAQRTFGYSAEEMIGEPILKLIPLDRQEEETYILSRLRNGERVEHFETKRLKKDGTLIDVSLTISPVKDVNGKITGISKIARDITERKQEEQRKNDFVAIVSHELKTPLTSITGYIQLLLSKARKEESEQNINILTRTEIQAKKMASMIQDFLNLAKMEEGKIQLNPQKFDLLPLVEEIMGDSQFISSRHEIEIKVSNGISLDADRDKIGQVLINLLSNAIKYSPQGGKITIQGEVQHKNVKVSVSDEGLGISLSDQKRLFDRFYRVNDDRVKSVSGFGIGLYFVSEILRYHKSNINVTSQEGIGSTFYFNLPLAD